MARALDDIIKELDAGYNPTRQLINSRLEALPAQAEAEIGGLKAQEQDYFQNTILGGARERGVAFGGIPEGERAQYGASHFLPAVARVRSSQNDVKLGLLEALNTANREQRGQAMTLYQTELDRDEAARQAELDRQATAARARAATVVPTLRPPTAPPTRPPLDAIFGGRAMPRTLPVVANVLNRANALKALAARR